MMTNQVMVCWLLDRALLERTWTARDLQRAYLARVVELKLELNNLQQQQKGKTQ